MGALGTYCFDGLNFSQASSLYTNSTLSVLAADGFYSQGGIVRQQLNGVLLNAQACSTCQPDVTLFNLCFAVTENDLCCDTSTPVAVYAAGLNVANLSSVVGDLYKDSFLQIKADNGFYSDDAGITCSSYSQAKMGTPPVTFVNYTCYQVATFKIEGPANKQVDVSLTFQPSNTGRNGNKLVPLNSSGVGFLDVSIGAAQSLQPTGFDQVTLLILNTSSSNNTAQDDISFSNCPI
jgi:hypothetical protein